VEDPERCGETGLQTLEARSTSHLASALALSDTVLSYISSVVHNNLPQQSLISVAPSQFLFKKTSYIAFKWSQIFRIDNLFWFLSVYVVFLSDQVVRQSLRPSSGGSRTGDNLDKMQFRSQLPLTVRFPIIARVSEIQEFHQVAIHRLSVELNNFFYS